MDCASKLSNVGQKSVEKKGGKQGGKSVRWRLEGVSEEGGRVTYAFEIGLERRQDLFHSTLYEDTTDETETLAIWVAFGRFCECVDYESRQMEVDVTEREWSARPDDSLTPCPSKLQSSGLNHAADLLVLISFSLELADLGSDPLEFGSS